MNDPFADDPFADAPAPRSVPETPSSHHRNTEPARAARTKSKHERWVEELAGYGWKCTPPDGTTVRPKGGEVLQAGQLIGRALGAGLQDIARAIRDHAHIRNRGRGYPEHDAPRTT